MYLIDPGSRNSRDDLQYRGNNERNETYQRLTDAEFTSGGKVASREERPSWLDELLKLAEDTVGLRLIRCCV